MSVSNTTCGDWRELHKGYLAYRTGHGRLLQVTAEVKRAIDRRTEGIIIVAGPTRVGKTTLLKGIINSILRESLSEMKKDPGFLPAAWMEAYPYRRGYRWADHWVGCLKALNEPLIEQKSAGYNIKPDRDARHGSNDYKYEREDVLRRSFESAAKHRRTGIFGIDEAQSIVVGTSGDKHRTNAEIIKSVANTSGTLHILVGHYEVLDLFNLSGQLGARTGRPIHFSRYTTDPSDLISFAAVVKDLTSQLPVPEPPRFEEMLEYLFDRSLGLIGLLHIWLSVALSDVLENGRKTVTRRDLEKYEPPEAVLDVISKETIEGEQRLSQDGNRFALIKARMSAGATFNETRWKNQGNSPEDVGKSRVAASDLPGAKEKETREKRPRRNSKPFERKPVRDKVGDGRNNRVA